jgi:aflatoxin B1 aldehyde reductase
MVELCLASGAAFRGLDTALMYSGGKSESLLGDMAVWKGVVPMATKINPWDGKDFRAGSVREQVEGCLARLRVASVQILYLHAPDHNTPLAETLRAMDELHKEGKFLQLGLSNYSSWLVNEVVNVCKANNWLKPTVYQVLTG